jgi:hypothetical protein
MDFFSKRATCLAHVFFHLPLYQFYFTKSMTYTIFLIHTVTFSVLHQDMLIIVSFVSGLRQQSHLLFSDPVPLMNVFHYPV